MHPRTLLNMMCMPMASALMASLLLAVPLLSFPSLLCTQAQFALMLKLSMFATTYPTCRVLLLMLNSLVVKCNMWLLLQPFIQSSATRWVRSHPAPSMPPSQLRTPARRLETIVFPRYRELCQQFTVVPSMRHPQG